MFRRVLFRFFPTVLLWSSSTFAGVWHGEWLVSSRTLLTMYYPLAHTRWFIAFVLFHTSHPHKYRIAKSQYSLRAFYICYQRMLTTICSMCSCKFFCAIYHMFSIVLYSSTLLTYDLPICTVHWYMGYSFCSCFTPLGGLAISKCDKHFIS